MNPGERKGWTEIISPQELDNHMANIGQAEANAGIVKQMFKDHPLESGSKLVVPGCGTCQLFDYIIPSDLGKIELFFTDINPSYLSKVKERLAKFPGTKYHTIIDDIEKTRLKGKYEGALIILVLQHVEWKKALDSICNLRASKLYVIEQEQDPTQHTVTKSRQLSDSIRKYAEIANPQLIPRKELVEYVGRKKYVIVGKYEKEVPDNKIMYGFVFERG